MKYFIGASVILMQIGAILAIIGICLNNNLFYIGGAVFILGLIIPVLYAFVIRLKNSSSLIISKLFFSFDSMKSKYLSLLRVVEPFVYITEGIINLILLPTPFHSNLSRIYLRALLKDQFKKRWKPNNHF